MSEAFVSVILAVRNEAPYIARTLNAVLHQDYPAEAMEIIVADGASDDGTVSRIRALDARNRIRIIANPERIQAAGLNLALQHARGDIVVRVDGHTVIARDYVRQCVNLIQQTEAWNVGGRVDPVGYTAMGKAIAAATSTAFAVPSAFHTKTTARFTDTVYLGAWPRWVFERIGGFNEHLPINEDYELNYRIRQMGGRIYLTPDIRSHYLCRQSLGALARQYLRYGLGKVDMLRRHPESLRLRQVVAPAFVAVLLGGCVLSPLSPITRVALVTTLATYGVFNAAFSAYAIRHIGGGPRVACRIPLVYLTIHVCWGMGFWIGVLQSIMAPRRGGEVQAAMRSGAAEPTSVSATTNHRETPWQPK